MHLNRGDKTPHQKLQSKKVYKNIRNTKTLNDNEFLRKMNISRGVLDIDGDPVIQKINLAYFKIKQYTDYKYIEKKLSRYYLNIIMRQMNEKTYEELYNKRDSELIEYILSKKKG